VSGLDTYKPITDVEVPFRNGSPVLSKDAKAKLDDMAKNLEGHQGFIIEIEARSPAAGASGIASSHSSLRGYAGGVCTRTLSE
jgi:hypothetical protein